MTENVVTPVYCTVENLLLKAGMIMPQTFDRAYFVNEAADEMNAMLGFVYTLPLTPISPAVELPLHQRALLKTINAKIATGRIYLNLQGDADGSLHAYGNRLLDEGWAALKMILEGSTPLSAELVEELTPAEVSSVPIAANTDGRSLVDAFEMLVHRGEDPDYIYPGEQE